MHGNGVSAVSAHTAHREWASRPPDERYASVQALHDAARSRRDRTEERTIDTGEFRTEAVVQRLDLSRKQAAEAYSLAEVYESNPRSVWGFVQGLTRLSQRTPWQDARFALDRAAGRILTTVH